MQIDPKKVKEAYDKHPCAREVLKTLFPDTVGKPQPVLIRHGMVTRTGCGMYLHFLVNGKLHFLAVSGRAMSIAIPCNRYGNKSEEVVGVIGENGFCLYGVTVRPSE
jgi:hypothetical protein